LPEGVVAATRLSNPVIGVWLDATHRTALVLYGREVPLSDVHSFAVIAGERGTVMQNVSLGEYMPATMVVDERNGHVLVTYMDSNSATLVDSRSGRIIRSLRLPFHPFGTLFNPDTGNAVVSAKAANRYLAAIIDLHSGSVRRTIALQAQGPAYGAGPPTLDATAHRILITSPGGVQCT
jgi:DNA-binding beta-propeller fold protein YncE